ncbi:MAG: surface lipoprotein assembly modifier [Proteobacteria bacterium]|nr:surface lipoprotein assembly modifier [Pseudomonadota bacterium]MDA1294678.1 surface lipoprotein assembly modifier [Pseudomonadota bacterium]
MEEFDIASQSERGLGIYGGLYLTRQTPLANGARFDFGVNFYDKAFRQHEFNMKTRCATASFNFPLSERSNASFSASKSRFSFGGEPYSDTTKLGASYGFSTAAGRILRFDMTHEKQNIIDNADQLTYENSGSVNFGVWRSKQTYVSLELRGNRRTSEHPAFDSWGKGASILARYNPKDTGWVIEGALSRNQKNWDRPSGITPDVRHDNEWLLSMSTYNSNFSFLGVTPTFRYTYQNRKSTIPIYSVLSHDVFVGVTNAF